MQAHAESIYSTGPAQCFHCPISDTRHSVQRRSGRTVPDKRARVLPRATRRGSWLARCHSGHRLSLPFFFFSCRPRVRHGARHDLAYAHAHTLAAHEADLACAHSGVWTDACEMASHKYTVPQWAHFALHAWEQPALAKPALCAPACSGRSGMLLLSCSLCWMCLVEFVSGLFVRAGQYGSLCALAWEARL